MNKIACAAQVGESSMNMSTLSAIASVTFESSSRTMAAYKGLNVVVCSVNKTDVNLSRQDLIELINVCSIYTTFVWPVWVPGTVHRYIIGPIRFLAMRPCQRRIL